MESIEQNPVYYDLAFEIPLHIGEVDVEEWLGNYAKRRYGLFLRMLIGPGCIC